MGCVMKRIIFVLLAIAPYASFAAAPSTSCPTGYVAVVEEHMDIANSSLYVRRHGDKLPD